MKGYSYFSGSWYFTLHNDIIIKKRKKEKEKIE